MGMDQYLLISFLGEWTSINPSYFDVNYRGTIGFDTLPYKWYQNCETRPLKDSVKRLVPSEASGHTNFAEYWARAKVEGAVRDRKRSQAEQRRKDHGCAGCAVETSQRKR